MANAKHDDNNLFAKIIRNEIPSFKIFETPHALAILDAFPTVEGHALLIPKAKCVSALDMSSQTAAAALAELPRLARMVQKATGAPGVNIVSNCGADAGQVIFHSHWHVIPRWPKDGLVKIAPGAKEMLNPEAAKAMLAKMTDGACYDASLQLLDGLMQSIADGAITPPPPPPAKAPPAAAPKAAAPAAAKAGSEKAAGGKEGGKPNGKEGGKPGGKDGGADGGAPKEAKKDGVKKEKVKKEAPPAEAGGEDRVVDVSWADIRVGKILKAEPHPQSDKLYVETIDLGEPSPRQILSGLAHHMSLDEVNGASVVCICNLKARKMAGVESQGMVLCASDADKSKLCFVAPPAGAAPGERVVWEGYPGEPETAKKMEKKKAWEAVQPLLNTNAEGVACYKDAPFKLASGTCTATVKGGIIS
jgi:methionine--tRNA ligase beta chain